MFFIYPLLFSPIYAKNDWMKSNRQQRRLFYRFIKRTFDIFSSLFVILLLSLLLIVISIIVKASSRGPVLFKDKRVGMGGKDIVVYKFRSMYVDAEERIDKYLTPEQKKTWKTERKIDNDPRITKIGKFIRKTSIDELPQLFNIFLGTMSVVGPRPITRTELDQHFTDEQKVILLSARPGLIGEWAVKSRSNADFVSGERQKLELDYFEKRGIFYDLSLIFKAIPAVLSHKGAK